ncbi:M15 family metallopeptidase [Spirosoma endbachense]|uniref:Peptidoglycan-binding protein n=1 Tax=Spirosoma endbachense TaxID=2666025 RepID=A0A6P1VPV7_9BACT|nr:M15 family metallopeptidase [Spirosoma endbachense]QHV94735.1 peptidoglycan-binding protein [Spirosoma endbachense]
MQVLKQGSNGADVKKWQFFLIGQGFEIGKADGDFGPRTHEATVAFQQQHGLLPDGVVGDKTVGIAMQLNFPVLTNVDTAMEGPNWPPRPDFPALIGLKARQDLFGKFTFESAPVPGNPENIKILGNWQDNNIVNVTISQLAGIPGAPASGTIPFHRLAVPQLQDMWAEWESAGLIDRVLSYGGSFVPRFIRGSRTTLSNHAFGTAFDINVAQNKLGTTPALVGKPGCVRELVPIANRHGFFWGGHFKSRLDGMHFEVAQLT